MLISCPECSHDVSDKALSCPMCGYPLKNVATAATPTPAPPRKRPRKYKRLPNGMGSIQRLSGKRAKPFAAYPPTKDFHLNGSAVRLPAIGYYTEWHEAYQALMEYNKDPSSASNLTFSEVFDLYFEEKYTTSKKTLSVASRQSTRAAFSNCAPLHGRRFKDIVASDLQAILDNCPLKHSSLELILSLFKGMYRYARKNNICREDYSQYVTINIPDDDEKGEPFTPEELAILWAHKDDLAVQMILIMIYSGFRIKAFETIDVNLKERYFRGGVKTAAGKNRIVPIHDAIYGFAASPDCLINGFKVQAFRTRSFHPALQSLGISKTTGGKTHTPHDCRHTFSWLCDKYHVDDVSKHMLMGHSMGNDVEKSVYSHRTMDELRNEINKISVNGIL